MAMPPGKNYITPAGYARLVDELTWLAKTERPRVVREVADAAAEGDRSENAAYIYGKKRLREIDRRMNFLTRRLDAVAVVNPAEQSGDRIFFGAQVEVQDEDTEEIKRFQIVGVDEVDVKAGKISWQSPIGRALLGKQTGDSVAISWHAGSRTFEVIEVQYPAEPVVPSEVVEKPVRLKRPTKAKVPRRK